MTWKVDGNVAIEVERHQQTSPIDGNRRHNVLELMVKEASRSISVMTMRVAITLTTMVR